jgi:HK97 family phage major capsid protein
MELIFKLQADRQAAEKRANDMQSLAEGEQRQLTAEEMTAMEGALNDVDAIDKQIQLAERSAKLKGTEGREFKPVGEQRDAAEQAKKYMDAFYKYLRVGYNKMTETERNILNFAESQNGMGVALDPTGEERSRYQAKAQYETRAANSVITNPAYTYPVTLAERFQYTLRSVGSWMSAINIMNDPAGNDLILPYYNDAGTNGYLEAEGTDAIASSTDLDSAKVTLTNYWFSSLGVKVNWSTLRDSNYPVDALVVKPLMDRLSRILSYYGAIGTGSSQPKGIAVAAVVGEITSKATYPTFTDLMNLMGKVDEAYHSSPTSGFMFHFKTMQGIASQVKSTTYNTDPLWQPSFADGIPKTLLGYPYWTNNFMNLITETPGHSVLFGDFSHFIMRLVGPVIITRLEELYAAGGQVGFLISQYMDSNVDMVGTTYAPIKRIKNIIT